MKKTAFKIGDWVRLLQYIEYDPLKRTLYTWTKSSSALNVKPDVSGYFIPRIANGYGTYDLYQISDVCENINGDICYKLDKSNLYYNEGCLIKIDPSLMNFQIGDVATIKCESWVHELTAKGAESVCMRDKNCKANAYMILLTYAGKKSIITSIYVDNQGCVYYKLNTIQESIFDAACFEESTAKASEKANETDNQNDVKSENIQDNTNQIKKGETAMATSRQTSQQNNATSNLTSEPKKKSIMDGLMKRFKSQYLMEKVEDGIKISMTGILCVKTNEDEYVGIDKENNLVSFPEEACLDFPVYIISKPISKVQAGDIILYGKSYSKVLAKNKDNSLKVLYYTGTTHNKKTVQDFILKDSFVKVVVNMFGEVSGINPLMLAMMGDNDMDMKELMMLQMITNGTTFGGSQNNPMQNPMMMLALMGKGETGSTNDLMEMMLMGQMMQNGCNLFGNNVQTGATENVTEKETKKETEE